MAGEIQNTSRSRALLLCPVLFQQLGDFRKFKQNRTFTLHLHYIYITFTLHLHYILHYIYITFTLHLHYIYIYITLHYIYITLHYITFTLHYIYITFTLHLHYIYITFTLHYNYITFTLHLHYIYITFTLHLHYNYITFTLHLHYIYIHLPTSVKNHALNPIQQDRFQMAINLLNWNHTIPPFGDHSTNPFTIIPEFRHDAFGHKIIHPDLVSIDIHCIPIISPLHHVCCLNHHL